MEAGIENLYRRRERSIKVGLNADADACHRIGKLNGEAATAALREVRITCPQQVLAEIEVAGPINALDGGDELSAIGVTD